jgi:rare lipoprotein A
VQVGNASWYGKQFHGRKMADGGQYDMYAMVAAHKKLPLGTRVRVTNLSNRKSVVVTIRDRGPYVAGRIIDMSSRAAKLLGMRAKGVTKVRIEVLR